MSAGPGLKVERFEGLKVGRLFQLSNLQTFKLISNPWLTAALIFVATRLVALAGAYAGASRAVEAEPWRNKGWFAELALMWDSAWYVEIVQKGYSWSPGAPGGTNVAFPPLYPFLLDMVSRLLGWISFGWDWGNGTYGTLIAAGLLVSNASFFVALALLIKLLSTQRVPGLGMRGAAVVALALASLPLAFFFSAIYAEGLFLMLALAALLVARSDMRGRWPAAGAIGMMAALLKIAGLVVLPMLLVEYLAQRGWSWRRVRADVLWLGLVPLGLAIFMLFLWWRFGSPQVFFDSQYKGWKHEGSFFLATYWDEAVALWRSVTGAVPPEQDALLRNGNGSRLYAILDLAAPVVLLAGGWAARKKLLASEWAWLLVGVVFPLSSGITYSLARYTLPLWPGLIWLGLLRNQWKWVAAAWIIASTALMAWCASIYGSARWIG
jgi:hypothetical protein